MSLKCRFHTVFLILISGSLLLSEGCKLLKPKQKTAEADGSVRENLFDAYFIDACTQFNLGNYAIASKLLNKCYDLKPDEASVSYQLSRTYFHENEGARSLQYGMKAWQLAPQNVHYALWYAERLRAEGNAAEAISVLEKTAEMAPSDEQVLKLLDAMYALKNNQLDKRIKLWESYRKSSGYKLKTALKLIELYKQNQDYASAHAVYDEIKKASPLKYQYFIDDGKLYLQEKDMVNARFNFDRALAINPNNFELNYTLFTQEAAANKQQEARRYIGQAFNDPLTGLDAKLGYCALLNQLYFKDSAYLTYTRTVAQTLMRVYPDNTNAIYTAGLYYEWNGQYDTALQAYKQVCQAQPGRFDAWNGILRMCGKLQLHGEKIAFARQALEYYPNVASIYLEAAVSSIRIKEYAQALEFCADGLRMALDPKDKTELLKTEGQAYFKLGKYNQAESSWLAAIAINAADAVLYDYLGDAYALSGQTDKAQVQWKKAGELGLTSNNLTQKIKTGKYVE